MAPPSAKAPAAVKPPAAKPVTPPAASAAKGSALTLPEGLTEEQWLDLEQRVMRLDELDYFEVLGVPRDVGMAAIKKAFYKESRAYHPDRFYHSSDQALKTKVNDVYKRVTEAYYVLRDDTKRAKYLADISGPERAQKLRFTEAAEVETKAAAKKQAEEQIGTHPKGRQFFTTGMSDFEAERWSAAERNFKMALTFEPSNARYKEMLTQAQQKVYEEQKKAGNTGFTIK
jgi:curved DNA-binding protein CbpA